MVVDKDLPVPMGDGTTLVADVYRFDRPDPMPAVLQRLPYGKEVAPTLAEATTIARAGYAFVVQDSRGRGSSGGTFDPYRYEAEDGIDTIKWIRGQAWSDGSVAMSGASYSGAASWLAAAAAPTGLKAIAPQITASSFYDGWTFRGGALQLGFLLTWLTGFLLVPEVAAKLAGGDAELAELGALIGAFDDLDGLFRTAPLKDAEVLRRRAPYYFEWLEHARYDDFWRATAVRERYEDIVVPSLNVGGWFDLFLGGTLENYLEMKRRGGTADARRPSLLIGPWAHDGMLAGEYLELSFGLTASAQGADLLGRQLRFFDRHVKGIENGAGEDPPVRLFIMGANIWRDEQDWPLPDTRFVDYFLHSGGGANTSAGDGELAAVPGTDEPEDSYAYDPHDPVPTVGGATLLPGVFVLRNAGPRDQASVEARPDVLCYSTPPLEHDVEVTGPITLVLYVSSSATDTDFTGKLVDVWPDGRAMSLTDGILRARYRKSLADPQPLVAGEVYELTIDLGATANVFRAGHRIRLEVSSSNFPRFDRNTNTGGVIAEESGTDFVTAVNRVFHDAARPSRLILPVIERGAVLDT
jgi:putative CocE/NonD family hydrolase